MFFSRKNIAHVFLACGLMANVSSNLFSMQPQSAAPGRLYFELNDKRIIESCLAVGSMQFAHPEAEFLGQDMLNVLEKNDKAGVLKGFDDARNNKEITFVEYYLKDECYSARIVPLFNLYGLKHYNVMVWKTEFHSEHNSDEARDEAGSTETSSSDESSTNELD